MTRRRASVGTTTPGSARAVKPAPFRYADPGSLDEALAVLSSEGEGAKVLAGGQSLIPLLSMRLAAPATLVDINRVPGLDTVEATGDGVRVGALVRHNQLLKDDAAARVQPLLARATANVAHPAVRNRGTTVGSIAHADPAGEMTSVLALTDGSVTVATPAGTSDVPWHDFFVGPLETSISGAAVVTSAFFPALPAARAPPSPRSPAARATTPSAAPASSSRSTRTAASPPSGPRTCPSGWCRRCTT